MEAKEVFEMSKYKTIQVWNKVFGGSEEILDYTGRLMKKSACGDPTSAYHPTIDHIRPLSKGGSDVLENMVICHKDTNAEKGNHFPCWKTNGGVYYAIRIKGTRKAYRIIKDK